MTTVLRPVTVLSTGGTIAMSGVRATPALDAVALLAAVPAPARVAGLRAARERRALYPAQRIRG